MYRNFVLIFLLIIGLSHNSIGQELNCTVSIRHDRITNVDKQVFADMERAISTFINNRKWTNDEYSISEKIECTIMFNLTSKIDGVPDAYESTINIQAVRPVYNTSYNTSLINFIDKEVAFKFNQFSPLIFDDNRVSGSGDALSDNLTASLAYYIYLILGLDYDSFSLNGGNFYFKRAQNVVSNAPEGKAINGWKAVESNKNRYWLIEQILNPRYSDFHKYWYTIHRLGFDNFYDKPLDAKKNILSGIGSLQKLNSENPNSILIQFFFNAKSNEFLKLLADMPVADRQTYITQLSQADVTNAQKYQELSK